MHVYYYERVYKVNRYNVQGISLGYVLVIKTCAIMESKASLAANLLESISSANEQCKDGNRIIGVKIKK